MKFQWTLLLGLAFALIVAVFAVINVDSVTVNYLFGQAKWPLILIILGSVLMGGIIVGSVGLFRMFVLQREVKTLKKQNRSLEEQLAQKESTPLEQEQEQQIQDIH
ncbi:MULTISPECIES: LapA family protein [Mesobacillus]|uniref:Lipopolysaccharide assembly protein A domain-containing protein n=2 Tax=Mesobacillus TaxID=2675231 RepID=A0A0D6Z959_9BACI|nr:MULTISPECIES: lipopolysaccharide assembly protein LapA domain-containing protein [Mesobacillus]KIY21123.1 hypothetical protein UB32_15480 [Mesobacillus subterraneus]MDQ0414533.1 putative integral membrane protein [Mesobacillus stamsii]